MKKLLLLFAAVLLMGTATELNAQDGKVLAGAKLNIATQTGYTGMGLSLNGVYLINETWEVGADFSYFFKNNFISMSTVNVNAHYNFLHAADDKINVYGLAGLNVTFQTVDLPVLFGLGGKASNTGIGFNLGAGGRYAINDKFSAIADVKYVIGFDNAIGGAIVFGAGVLYHF